MDFLTDKDQISDKKSIFSVKNILIIGGAGFIGSHLCDELIKKSRVICLDNFSSGDEKNIDHLLSEPNFKFIRHDICEPIRLEDFNELKPFDVAIQGVQEIYNLACPTSPKEFENYKLATIHANSLGIKNSLDMALKYKAKYLHFSSSVVYGPRRPDNKKMSETDIGAVDQLSPRACYDESKRFAETMIDNYRSQAGVDAKIIRLFRIYGPRMKMADGQMIPDMIAAALDNRDLEIFGGKDFTSSFCYVSDCIDAVLKIMEKKIDGPVNVGSDIEINLTELANKIIALIGSKSEVVYKDKLLFYSPLPLPNIDKARESLGWLPIVTMEKGLEKTIYELRASKGLVGFQQSV